MFERIFEIFRRNETPAARIGRLGENAAAKFLAGEGLKIVARNFRSGHGEIDIVARDAGCLVFVEVKTRSENAVVDGYYAAVSKKKLAVLRKCARAFMSRMPNKPDNWRFDAVEVRHDRDGKPVSVRHFPNVG